MLRLFVAARGLLSSCGMWASEHTGPVVVARRLSNSRVLAQVPHSIWNLTSPHRDQTHAPCVGRQILNHWTYRDFLSYTF